MTRRIPALLLLLSLAVAGTLTGSAAAATKAISSNWAGYVVDSSALSVQPISFSSVSGSWVQPVANCTQAQAQGTGETSSAFWVGLGGNSDSSNALEQTGTESDCSASGVARYSAWYELVPASSVRIKLTVEPGDTVSASVSVAGSKVTVQLANVTRGTSFSKVLTMASPDAGSAEWIAEAPSVCSSSYDCSEEALTDFDTVKFSNASAVSNGHTGTIADPNWTATEIDLDAAAGGRGGYGGYGRYQPQFGSAQALPTSLASKGSAFTVKWKSVTATQPSGGYGYGGGYGNGGGYGYGGG